MAKLLNTIAALALAGILTTSLISCGGGGSSDSTTTTTAERTGIVGLLFTDKPADPSLFLAMNATIESVELIGSDDDDVVDLYSDEPQTIDLLRLKNESIPFTFSDDVPVGTYCKIRLTLSDLELVLVDDTPDDLTDNETHHPQLPGNGKLDLLARGCFTVEEGNVITVQVDIDGGNSIHVVGNNNGFNFRPVVFVDVLEEGFESKLVRLQGEISEVIPEEDALLLCDALPVQQSDSMECVKVKLNDDTAFFDNQTYEGMPRSLDELLMEEKVGEQLVVVGWPEHHVMPHSGVNIPGGHLPSPGECRLWTLDEPPGQQPAPGDCEELEDLTSDDEVLVDHEGVVRDRYHPLMEVDALVVELGEFQKIEGEVSADADSSGFDMDVIQGDTDVEVGPLAVMFQAGEPGINGTRIVSKSGDLLDYSEIIALRTVQVDGVPDMSGAEAMLKAALVIVDTATSADDDDRQVTGSVVSTGASGFVLSPDTDTVCGVATTDLMVSYADDVDFLTVVITETVSEITPGGTLEAGQEVGVNGSCSDQGYIAESIVIVDDQRTP
ncbi:MAG: DUF4382 domain-containing protein [Candidatus Thiodiazotropha sp.]